MKVELILKKKKNDQTFFCIETCRPTQGSPLFSGYFLTDWLIDYFSLMIIWKWSDRRTGLCLPRIQSHLTVGDPVASGILRLSKSNTLISRNIILACNWKESRKIKDYDKICLRGPNSVVDFFFLLVMATQTVTAWSADFLFIYLFMW